MKKRILSVLLTFMMVLSIIPFGFLRANAACALPLPEYPAGTWYGQGECWSFANLVYEKYWGYRFDNNQYSSDNLIRNVPINYESRIATAANLKKYISSCPIGSCVRISRTLDYVSAQNDGDAGHSFIVVNRDDNGFTCYDIMNGYVCLNYRTYDYYAKYIYLNGGLPVGNAYVKYIKAGSGNSSAPTILQTVNCKYYLTVAANSGRISLYDSATTSAESDHYYNNKTEPFRIVATKRITLSTGIVRFYFYVESESRGYYVTWNPNTMAVEQKHEWSSWKTTKKATCYEDGVYKRTCICGAAETTPIPRKNHNIITIDGKPATCSETGLTDGRKCSDCGFTLLAQLPIAKTPHIEVIVKGKAATCTEAGYTEGKKCLVCGTIINAQNTIAKKDHTYSNNCDISCNLCKATRSITHTYKTTTAKATLSKNGSIVKKCTVCGKVASNTAIKYAKTFKLSTTTYTYNGKIKTPTVTVKDSEGKTLKKNTDYTVTYASGRKNAGTYKVTVKMIGKYSGTKTLTFKINPIKLSSYKLSATTYTYDGKVKTPSVTVKNSIGTKLTKNTHYTISYASGRKNVGTYKITIKGKGNYIGTKTLSFKINPAKTTVSKLTAGKKSITVAISKKSTQVTGYQIQYSTSKTFSKATTKTISSYKTTKYNLKNLSAKKTYYVRVRTYKTVGKTKYYSGWSTYKYVKTK